MPVQLGIPMKIKNNSWNNLHKNEYDHENLDKKRCENGMISLYIYSSWYSSDGVDRRVP